MTPDEASNKAGQVIRDISPSVVVHVSIAIQRAAADGYVKGVQEERERCARIAEQFTHKCPETGSCFEHHKAEVIARMIRANGSTETR